MCNFKCYTHENGEWASITTSCFSPYQRGVGVSLARAGRYFSKLQKVVHRVKLYNFLTILLLTPIALPAQITLDGTLASVGCVNAVPMHQKQIRCMTLRLCALPRSGQSASKGKCNGVAFVALIKPHVFIRAKCRQTHS